MPGSWIFSAWSNQSDVRREVARQETRPRTNARTIPRAEKNATIPRLRVISSWLSRGSWARYAGAKSSATIVTPPTNGSVRSRQSTLACVADDQLRARGPSIFHSNDAKNDAMLFRASITASTMQIPRRKNIFLACRFKLYSLLFDQPIKLIEQLAIVVADGIHDASEDWLNTF